MIAFTKTASTTTTLKALLAASITTNNLQSIVWFHDVPDQVRPDNKPYLSIPQYGAPSGTGETAICDAPTTGYNRVIDGASIYNADTVAATVTVFLDDGTNRLLCKVTLQTTETLHYEPGGAGWYVTDASGNRKVTVADSSTFTWTPTLTFGTPGDLNVGYSTRLGTGVLLGGVLAIVKYTIVTSTFTHMTASGNCNITGCPYTPRSDSQTNRGANLSWQGITKANYTDVVPSIFSGSATITLRASGSGQTGSTVGTADMPTGGTVSLIGEVSFLI